LSTDSFYKQKIAACDEEIRAIQNRLNGMAVVRLALFTGLGFTIYAIVRESSPLLVILAIALLAAFILCVNIHYRWKEQRLLLQKLRFVNVNELDRLSGKANSFADGAAFLDTTGYLDDLDVFGPHSLFHVLNRTSTVKGREFLAQALRQPLLDPAAIRQEQAAIQTLAPQTDSRQLITAHGLLNEGKAIDLDSGGFRRWLETPAIFNRKPLRLAAIALLMGLNLTAIAIWMVSNNYTLLLLGVLISRLVLVLYGKYTGQQHELIDNKKPLLDQYAGILAVFNTVDAGDSLALQKLRDRTVTAHNAIRRLSSLANYFDHRSNGLVNLFLNTFLLYDLHCVIALERWKEAYRTNFIDWLEAVGAVERLNSQATFAFNYPDYHYPSPEGTAETLFIEATRLAHPLIPAERRIANDCTLGRGERLILVTGSNMSGKTTFLRTIGVNLLLAQCGMPVCAASFSFTPMHLLTSLRIDDSLLDQTSYFMAELKKLQRIVHRLQTGAPALVLIDEILRGTNSEDKTFGSEHFIRRLIQFRCLSLFATHDLTLGSLEQAGLITNYCFESVIENDELHFNYQLQRGIARNRNASFLMRKMDII
jgi:hypothetical protein